MSPIPSCGRAPLFPARSTAAAGSHGGHASPGRQGPTQLRVPPLASRRHGFALRVVAFDAAGPIKHHHDDRFDKMTPLRRSRLRPARAPPSASSTCTGCRRPISGGVSAMDVWFSSLCKSTLQQLDLILPSRQIKERSSRAVKMKIEMQKASVDDSEQLLSGFKRRQSCLKFAEVVAEF